MKCPRCQRRLKADAISCFCGWRAATDIEAPRGPECAFMGCTSPALVRVRGDGNAWVNLCITHYPTWFTPERIAARGKQEDNHACAEVRKAFQRSNYSRIKVERGIEAAKQFVREPGQDDDEALAA